MNMDPRERGEGVEVQALPRALQVAVQLDGNGGSRSHVVEPNQLIGDDYEMFPAPDRGTSQAGISRGHRWSRIPSRLDHPDSDIQHLLCLDSFICSPTDAEQGWIPLIFRMTIFHHADPR